MPHPTEMSPRRRSVSVVLLAAAVLVVLPDCGGGSSPTNPPAATTPAPPPATLPPTPTKLTDLSASVTSPQSQAALNCTDDIRAQVTLVNNGATDVAVRGVLMRSGVTSGACGGDNEFTYSPRTPIAPAKRTTIVLDGSLYPSGAGCCSGKGCGSSCRIQEGFEVITDLGNVPAGAFNYQIFFQNCRSCGSVRTSSGRACVRVTGVTPAVPQR
jgi:hypothetical protein